jgi:predicted nucleic acid-binding protein
MKSREKSIHNGSLGLNASPIICLAKAGYSDLLLKLADEIIVPQTVAEEIQAGHLGDPAEQILATGKFPMAEILAMPEILAWDLGKGETAVLSYALANQTWTAIIDDQAARKCARSFSIPVKGTLAVVILAKKRGLVGSAADVMRSLQAAGLRLDDDLIRIALKQTVDEEW